MGDRMRLTDAVSGLFVDKQDIARRISSQEITIVSRHLIIIQLMRHQLPKKVDSNTHFTTNNLTMRAEKQSRSIGK